MFDVGETVVCVKYGCIGEYKATSLTEGKGYKVKSALSTGVWVTDDRGVDILVLNERFRKQTPCEKAGIKVGDKCEAVRSSYSNLPVGTVVTLESDDGSRMPAFDVDDDRTMFLYGEDWQEPSFVKKKTMEVQTEAEKRGAKFGTKGVVKATGKPWVLVVTDGEKWYGVDNEGKITNGKHSDFRLDHEPEFIAWVDAPESDKWDAAKVYYDDRPVKWIAKPEGALVTDVVAITKYSGIVILTYHRDLKVKA